MRRSRTVTLCASLLIIMLAGMVAGCGEKAGHEKPGTEKSACEKAKDIFAQAYHLPFDTPGLLKKELLYKKASTFARPMPKLTTTWVTCMKGRGDFRMPSPATRKASD